MLSVKRSGRCVASWVGCCSNVTGCKRRGCGVAGWVRGNGRPQSIVSGDGAARRIVSGGCCPRSIVGSSRRTACIKRRGCRVAGCKRSGSGMASRERSRGRHAGCTASLHRVAGGEASSRCTACASRCRRGARSGSVGSPANRIITRGIVKRLVGSALVLIPKVNIRRGVVRKP